MRIQTIRFGPEHIYSTSPMCCQSCISLITTGNNVRLYKEESSHNNNKFYFVYTTSYSILKIQNKITRYVVHYRTTYSLIPRLCVK